MLMGIASDYDITDKIEDYEKGFFTYSVKCILTRNGCLVCTGVGNCNSKEKKYITQDPFSIANTILKMGKKRAYVDATLSLASLSDIFTQDIEDMNLPTSNATNSANQGKSPGDTVLTFGKNKGRTIADLFNNDKGYFDWLVENNEKMKPICEAYVQSLKEVQQQPTWDEVPAADISPEAMSTLQDQKTIHIEATRLKWSDAKLKANLKKEFGTEHTAELTDNQAKKLVAWFKKQPKPKEAEKEFDQLAQEQVEEFKQEMEPMREPGE
jgi:hypothetical protein